MYHFVAAPLDDQYTSVDCMERCLHAGSVDCPPYLEWLRQSHKLGKDAPPIADICDSFETISDLEWEGDLPTARGAADKEVDDVMSAIAEERKAAIENSFQHAEDKGYL